MSKPVSYRIAEDGPVVLSRPANLSELRGPAPDKSVLDPDMQIKIDEKVWGVNRFVIRVCSRLNDAMMNTNMGGPKSNEIPLDPTCLVPEVLDKILDLLYDGKVTVRSEEIVDILAASNFLQYKELAEACISFLQDHLDTNVLTKTWEYANLSSDGGTELLGICEKGIPGLFREWSKKEDFCHLSYKALSRVMEKATLRKKNRNENEIFEAIVRWLYFDWAGRCCNINKMLAKIQWKTVNSGKAIECDLIRNVCQTKMQSEKECHARTVLLRAIGLGPEGDFEGLFGTNVSTPTELVVAGIIGGREEIALTTLYEIDHDVKMTENLAIPAELRPEGMVLADVCCIDTKLYVLALTKPGYVLYEYDHRSQLFQYAVLRPPPGHKTFADHPAFTRVFLDGETLVIADEAVERNGMVYYMPRAQLVFIQDPIVNVNDAASCQLLKVDIPAEYAQDTYPQTVTYDCLSSRLYYCCRSDAKKSSRGNLMFYLNLQSKAFVRCPDCPLIRNHIATTVHDGALLFAGGYHRDRMEDEESSNESESSSEVWRLDKDGSNWVELPSMNMKHSDGSLLVNDGQLYHFDTIDWDDCNDRLGLEILDLNNTKDGWKIIQESYESLSTIIKVRTFLN